MKCPSCQCLDSKVIDSRSQEDAIRRRRECLNCKTRFTTYERLERKLPLIIKRDHVREPYNPTKIQETQLGRRKRPVTAHQLEHTVTNRAAFNGYIQDEITSAEVGELVLACLKDLAVYLRLQVSTLMSNPSKNS